MKSLRLNQISWGQVVYVLLERYIFNFVFQLILGKHHFQKFNTDICLWCVSYECIRILPLLHESRMWRISSPFLNSWPISWFFFQEYRLDYILLFSLFFMLWFACVVLSICIMINLCFGVSNMYLALYIGHYYDALLRVVQILMFLIYFIY